MPARRDLRCEVREKLIVFLQADILTPCRGSGLNSPSPVMPRDGAAKQKMDVGAEPTSITLPRNGSLPRPSWRTAATGSS
jgi:hypothetical protein